MVVSRILRRGLLASLLAAALGTGLLSGSKALSVTSAPTSVAISAPSDGKIGSELAITARLTTNGQAVTSRILQLSVDGGPVHTESVDQNGVASFHVRGAELTTAHVAQIVVRFTGSASLLPSASSVSVPILPVVVTIETIPHMDGVPITIGSARALTKNGFARLAVPKLGTSVLNADVAKASVGPTRTDFVRWSDDIFTARRDLVIKHDVSLQLGVHVAYRGSFEFIDARGAPVPVGRIKSVSLTSTDGVQLSLTNYTNVWLDAGTAVKRLGGLYAAPRSWRVLTVEMAGTNVVNRGQQRIEPAPGAIWKVELLLYDLRVEAHDALFGSSISGKLELVYPDGTKDIRQLGGANAQALFARLPRGDYTLLLHADGIGAPTPVALSRSQDAAIRVITYLDLWVFASLLVAGAAALLWFGRRQQVLSAASGVQGGAIRLRRGVSRRLTAAAKHAAAAATATATRGRSSVAEAATGFMSRSLHASRRTVQNARRSLVPRHVLSIAGPTRAKVSRIWNRRRLRKSPISPLREPGGVSLAAVLARTMRETPMTPPRSDASGTSGSSVRARGASKAARRPTSNRTLAVCPACKRPVPSTARYCVACGQTIPEGDHGPK